MKMIASSLLLISLLVTVGWSMPIRRSSLQKFAIAYFQSEDNGSHAGTLNLKVNGKMIAFSWWNTTRFKNFWDNPNAHKAGAELRIIYKECRGDSCPSLISVTFTGRIKK